MPKTLYLLRHAWPDYPGGERLCLGRRMDLPLGARGFAQTEALAKAFENIPLDRVYASPMLRTRQTAQALTKGQVILLEELIELDGGVWDGQPFRKIRAEYPEFFLPDAPGMVPPGGEPDEDGAARGMKALDIMASAPGETIAAVSHASMNRLILSSIMGRPLCMNKTIAQDYACVNVLTYDGKTWHVEKTGLDVSRDQLN